MKTLKTSSKLKVLIIGLLFMCINIYSQKTTSTRVYETVNISDFLTHDSRMMYSIYNPPTTNRTRTQFTFFNADAFRDILRGQAYFVISKSNNINILEECYVYTITTRFYPDRQTPTTKETYITFNNYKRFRGIVRTDEYGYLTYKMVTDDFQEPPQGSYYHYIILYVYISSTMEWKYIVLTEPQKTRFTIGYSPSPDPDPKPESSIDIAFTDFSIYNSINYPNNTITATVKAKNTGNIKIENVTGKFYISDKSAYENNYNTINCGSQSLGSLSAGEERTFSVNISLPSEGILNSYFPNKTNLYLLGYLESIINEKNTKDNSKAISITIIH